MFTRANIINLLALTIAVVLGTVAAFLLLLTPAHIVDRLLSFMSIYIIFPFAAPPLTVTGHSIFALLAGLLLTLFIFLFLGMFGRSLLAKLFHINALFKTESVETRPRETMAKRYLRRADAHPDAPPRRPFHASTDMEEGRNDGGLAPTGQEGDNYILYDDIAIRATEREKGAIESKIDSIGERGSQMALGAAGAFLIDGEDDEDGAEQKVFESGSRSGSEPVVDADHQENRYEDIKEHKEEEGTESYTLNAASLTVSPHEYAGREHTQLPEQLLGQVTGQPADNIEEEAALAAIEGIKGAPEQLASALVPEEENDHLEDGGPESDSVAMLTRDLVDRHASESDGAKVHGKPDSENQYRDKNGETGFCFPSTTDNNIGDQKQRDKVALTGSDAVESSRSKDLIDKEESDDKVIEALSAALEALNRLDKNKSI